MCNLCGLFGMRDVCSCYASHIYVVHAVCVAHIVLVVFVCGAYIVWSLPGSHDGLKPI